jgi:hypothetical protein
MRRGGFLHENVVVKDGEAYDTEMEVVNPSTPSPSRTNTRIPERRVLRHQHVFPWSACRHASLQASSMLRLRSTGEA